jgi:hypothetical protein
MYALLIMMASGPLLYTILAEASVASGVNDRSRWATVRALVDDGTYCIGRREWTLENGTYTDRGIIAEPEWGTVDLVLHPDTQRFYSSKPPLFPTLLAGEYCVLKWLLDWSITDPGWPVQKTILLTVNAVPLVALFMLIAWFAERYGVTTWARIYVLAAAGFGTFLTTFGVVLNNHTVAAFGALASVAAVVRSGALAPSTPRGHSVGNSKLGDVRWPWFAVAGFLAGLTLCLELTAASLAAAIGGILILRTPKITLIGFLPALLVPVSALLFTNYCALQQARPAYAEFGGPWYNYPGSYWSHSGTGIDTAGQFESKLEYAFHLLLGHHGLLSLTPTFFLSAAGVAMTFRRHITVSEASKTSGATNCEFRLLAFLTALLTVVNVGFYVIKTSNYGGLTCCARWLLWLAPLFLIMMLPAADRLAFSRRGRLLGYVALLLSIASVSYSGMRPWSQPWLYDLMKYLGYVGY